MSRMIIAVSAASLALITGACSKKAPESLPPAPSEAPIQTSSSQGSGIQLGSQADFVQRMAGKDTIYFETDRYNIDDVDVQALRTQAEWLMQYPSKRASIQGHADERGTREYNLALGERRANAASNFLTSLGVAPNRLSIVSYGSERPANSASSESAWAQNRRAVTVTID